MRGVLLVALMLVLATPMCSATGPIVPALIVTISPSSKEVTSPPNLTVTVNFDGAVTVDKLPFVRVVVSLTPTVDAGWPATCDPSTIVVTDGQPHDFICNVTVPENSQNGTGDLTIEAVGHGGGFTVTASASAVITVHGTAFTNKTGGTGGKGTGTNQTGGGGTGQTQAGSLNLGSTDMKTVAILVVVLAVAAVGTGTYWVHRRRKARLQPDWYEEAPVEEVQPL